MQGGSSGDRTDGTEEPKPNDPEPEHLRHYNYHICFYKSDGTTKADKADEKETVDSCKGCKNSVQLKKSYNGYQALPMEQPLRY